MLELKTREERAIAPEEPTLVSGRGLAAWQVRRVVDRMKNRLEEGLSLADAAAAVGLSRSHFCTAFRLATGRTPREWLTTLRIERAQELLINPTVPITNISLAVGYQTPSAFTYSFRRYTGMTPTQFRRINAVDPLLLAFDGLDTEAARSARTYK